MIGGAYLKALKTWGTFGKGWSSRVEAVRKVGQEWASGPAVAVTLVAAPVVDASAKAPPEDVRPAPPVAPADAGIGLGVGTASIGGALASAKDTLAPLASGNEAIQKVVAVLVIAGVVVAVGSVVYRIWASRKQSAVTEATA